jgi:glycosyltransferase involved in cell wall biosynthesis
MISFIVPAHNEEACLGPTLQAIHESARAVGLTYEIIVANDASTDATAQVAQQNNARVVGVNHRQIAATRNSGARAASGNLLFFVDADTIINSRAVASAVRAMDKGAVGGGALPRLDRSAPLYAWLLVWWFVLWLKVLEIAGGAFMFCTRDAFEAVGGFDERLFGAEDAAMSWALRRQGRFVVLWKFVSTSGRRLHGMRGLQMFATLIRMGFSPRLLTRRSSVEKVWYDSNREESHGLVDLFVTQGANAVLLLFTVVIITNPLFGNIPQLKTLIGGPLLNVRFGINILLCHVWLLLWPCAWLLSRHLFRQTRWLDRAKVIGLIALCLWWAVYVTRVVIWFWPWLFHQFP